MIDTFPEKHLVDVTLRFALEAEGKDKLEWAQAFLTCWREWIEALKAVPYEGGYLIEIYPQPEYQAASGTQWNGCDVDLEQWLWRGKVYGYDAGAAELEFASPYSGTTGVMQHDGTWHWIIETEGVMA